MKKNLLSKKEKEQLRLVGMRVEQAMYERGIKSIHALNVIIKTKRGDCPDRSFYHKLKYPPGTLDHIYYNMTIEYLFVLSDALEVSTDYLLGKRGD